MKTRREKHSIEYDFQQDESLTVFSLVKLYLPSKSAVNIRDFSLRATLVEWRSTYICEDRFFTQPRVESCRKPSTAEVAAVDPYARAMATGSDYRSVGYNVQAAVDTKHHIVVANADSNPNAPHCARLAENHHVPRAAVRKCTHLRPRWVVSCQSASCDKEPQADIQMYRTAGAAASLHEPDELQ